MSSYSLTELRADFDLRSKGSLSMPIAGLIVWTVVAFLGWILPFKQAVLGLVFATGAIFPIALGVARLRDEQLINNINPLAKLMGNCVVMVNLLWALHIPLLMNAPQFVPLSLGIGLGLHWVVYSWIIANPLGMVHAVVRSVGLIGAWYVFPDHLVTASAAMVVLAYAFTLLQMVARAPLQSARPAAQHWVPDAAPERSTLQGVPR